MNFLFGLSLILWAIQAPAQSSDGVISGRVLRAGGSEGIAQAEILLAGPLPQTALNAARSNPLMLAEIAEGSSAPLTRATTESDGTFVFRNLAPGRYVVRAQREGYLGDPRTTGGFLNVASAETTVAPGTATDIQLNLTRGGVISGTVRDVSGQRAPSLTVTAFQLGYRDGREILVQVSSKTTDDRGEYRLFWLPPGEYYLAVNPPSVPGVSRPVNSLTRTFYPGTTDARTASVIKLTEGSEFTGADIELRTTPKFKVSGRVENELSPAAEPVVGVPNVFYLLPTDADFLHDAGTPVFSNVSRAAGFFEIQGVPPGSYDLIAAIPDSNGQPALGRVHVNVGSEDLDGVTLSIKPGAEMRARISLDGKPLAAASPSRLPRIQLRSAENYSQPFESVMPVFTPDLSGEYVLSSVPQGAYRVAASVLPEDAYVADIRMGNESIFDNGFVVGDRAPETIDVMLKSGSLSIAGAVVDASGKPASSATVVIVPASNRRQNPSLYRAVKIDGNAEFELNDLAPGEYKLFAWDTVPNTAYMNSAFIAKYESFGLSVNLVAGGNLTFDLTLIPADETR